MSQIPKKFSFKGSEKYDLALLSEVETVNPFSVNKRAAKSIWQTVAQNLGKSELKLTGANSRNCRERTELLLQNFRREERKSLNASGISEMELTPKTILLTSVANLEDLQKKLPDGLKVLYSKKQRSEAENVRNAALLKLDEENPTVEDRKEENQTQASPTDEEVDFEPLFEKRTKSASRKSAPGDIVSYLSSKNEREAEQKKEELKVRSAEADNKNLELQLLEQRQKAEIEKDKKMSDLILKLLEKSTQVNQI